MTGTEPSAEKIFGKLRVLATTDLHANLLSYDYYSDRPNPGVGLSRVSMLVDAARREADAIDGATLLVDNGDSLFGTPIAEQKIRVGEPSSAAVPKAFSLLGYDAVGLGNHEFDFGLEALRLTAAQITCPVICSNIRALNPDMDLPFAPYAVLERSVSASPAAPSLRIGLLSVLPPHTMKWGAYQLTGALEFDQMVDSAAVISQHLKENENCDLVICLAHTGLADHDNSQILENALSPLADLDGLDAIVAGHTHLTLPDSDHQFDIPVVMPGAYGSHLGLIDLDLELSRGRWSLVSGHASLQPIAVRTDDGELVPQVDEDKRMVEALASLHQETREQMAQPVGRTEHRLHSFFSLIHEDKALALTAYAQAAAIRPLLRETAAANIPLLSASAPGKFGGRAGPTRYSDVPAGAMHLRHVADIQPFPNELRAVIVTGRELRDWLEMSAGVFNHITPGQAGQMLIDPDRAGHNFDVIFGVEYEIDVSAPNRFDSGGGLSDAAASRIRNLTWNGVAVTDSQYFAVVSSSFRINGGGNFSALETATPLPLPTVRTRDAICDYVGGKRPPDPLTHGAYPWRFSDLGGTTVEFLTGPDARKHLPDLQTDTVRPIGLSHDGFLRLQLTL
ncbi:5'-nucleotidase C-terminal domain-containing protein [Phaeobacter sp.]|uniref:5'-nucleotidase C-terminal domain-containing protein n=1 Tax=Phaeobacter sp. TaxID=1902409 RepID=UPI0025DB52E7|nr:5'-nucleotidase C-terminal domain-containing protein [Phaeobacter sp.]